MSETARRSLPDGSGGPLLPVASWSPFVRSQIAAGHSVMVGPELVRAFSERMSEARALLEGFERGGRSAIAEKGASLRVVR